MMLLCGAGKFVYYIGHKLRVANFCRSLLFLCGNWNVIFNHAAIRGGVRRTIGKHPGTCWFQLQNIIYSEMELSWLWLSAFSAWAKNFFSVDIFRSLSRSLVPVPRRETLKFISLQKLFFFLLSSWLKNCFDSRITPALSPPNER